ncbi:phi LC3 family holin [Virgibacillus halotolerans]|uniref:phage holin family protein n=1 Tax=Virgibacillus halotolerans TaxID=1071053 RepID=UPI001960BE8E|nr:phage holin family protein [Virgibacillus halotolerans]MBM7598066.1 phi LC3 family holin [Virgibacillus halotolerans]
MDKNKKGINWQIRAKNPVFWAQVLLAVLTPILAYVGLSFGDLTTWSSIADLIQSAYSNPYLLGLVVVSVFNSVTDPTVSGISDSELSRTYTKPKKNK